MAVRLSGAAGALSAMTAATLPFPGTVHAAFIEGVMAAPGRGPTLRAPAGSHELAPSDIVFFPRGPAGAHQIRNDGDEPAHVLMWSAVVHPTATVYPDSDKIAIWTGNQDDELIAPRAAGVEYFHGET